MKNTQKQHIAITKNVKEKIQSLNIVFPSHYAKIYGEEACLQNVELHPDELLDSDMLNEKVVNHLISLTSCTQRAIEAIESEDTATLQAVLAETKTLRDEIDELRKIIYEDVLTKSYNRKWFEDFYLDSDRLTIRKDGVLVLIDLNKFKYINDTFGHNVGDKVLTHIAYKLKEIDGQIVRYGGDEFLAIFDPSESPASITRKFESMIEKCDKTSFKSNEQNFKISFAYGITPFKQGALLSEIIDTADKEMYAHKRARELSYKMTN